MIVATFLYVASASEVRGEPLETLDWPPRVLEEQPLNLLLKQSREPLFTAGFAWWHLSRSGISHCITLYSCRASYSGAHPTPDDEAVIAEVDTLLPELFIQ